VQQCSEYHGLTSGSETIRPCPVPRRAAGKHAGLADGLSSPGPERNDLDEQLHGGEVPPDRRPGWTPVTTAFPSGHAAASAAFATGVGLEMPALAAPVGALAAAVGISRVVNGVHYPSDIAGDGQSAWVSEC
jgi:hypothetical protein